jgi:hypothetical protein
MKTLNTYTGTLHITGRENNSVMGNPRYKAFIELTDEGDGFEVLTKPNSMIAYELSNYDGKRVTVQLGDYHKRLNIYSIKEA